MTSGDHGSSHGSGSQLEGSACTLHEDCIYACAQANPTNWQLRCYHMVCKLDSDSGTLQCQRAGTWKLGGKGQSCDEVCSGIGKKCDLDALLEIKDVEKANEIFENLPCTSGPKTPMKTSVKVVSPSVLEFTSFGDHFNCYFDGDGRNAKCDSQHSEYKRLCFCKN